MSTEVKKCNKCRKQEGVVKFKSPNRKRCIDCNNKQYMLNAKQHKVVKSVLQEALDLKLYKEYERLKQIREKDSDYEPHYNVLTAVIKIIEYDNDKGFTWTFNTDEDKKYWEDVYDELYKVVHHMVEGYPWANPRDMVRNVVYTLEEFIPPRIYKEIVAHFDGYDYTIMKTRKGVMYWGITTHPLDFHIA